MLPTLLPHFTDQPWYEKFLSNVSVTLLLKLRFIIIISHHVCIAGESRSVVLAPLPRRTALLQRSAGEQLSLDEQDPAICSLGEQNDVSNVYWEDGNY